MNILSFQSNKIVWFWTSYNQGKYRNFVGRRCYLLFSVEEKFLNFFPITSNRIYFDTYVNKHKVSEPRPSCLESKIYLESFIITNILIKVPLEAVSYLNFCNKHSSFCLEKDFKEITKLHSDLPSYDIEIDKVEVTIEYFLKPQSSKNKEIS